MNPRLLLFDIDGTLLYTGGAGRIAIERVFLELFGIEEAWGGLRPDGMTDTLIFQEIALRTLERLLTAEELAECKTRYCRYFRAEMATPPDFRLMPGIPGLFHRLEKETHLHLGIQTGNYEEAAWIKLEAGGLQPYFSFGGFGSDAVDRKDLVAYAAEAGCRKVGERVPAERIFVIGDAPQDIRAGRALGMKTIAVTTGRATREMLETEKPDLILPDLTNPAALLAFFYDDPVVPAEIN